MIPLRTYEGKTIGVFGLARTGLAALSALFASKARVLAYDDALAHNPGDLRMKSLPVPLTDLYEADFSQLDALMLAPGVPLTHPAPHPLVLKARAAHVPVIGDIEIFAKARSDLPPHGLIAVTGTNGKSTTAALLAHLFAACGRDVALAGNIGIPVLGLEALDAGGVYVFEMSSFQIDLTHSLDADVAILLNISPDHLERHGDMAGYVAAKARLFQMQGPQHLAVISVDDPWGAELARRLPQRTVPISVRQPLDHGVYVTDGGDLIDARSLAEGARLIGSLGDLPTLRGRHNWQNAAAAYVAGLELGLDAAGIMASFASFPGLAHRCERVGVADDVVYINDSKATNIDAAATALAAFDQIRWIAGGRAKSTDLAPLEPFFGRIKKAYLLGEAAPDFAKALDGKLDHVVCGTMAAAVAAAIHDARPGETVLLSPACASFDHYRDFEARGDDFRAIVRRLLPHVTGPDEVRS
ncbi:UDP-N-acetylmuramoylalanine--D-glutamate ligase [alpha proteobacterium Q-1]|nr:UDP-N-acetylmuramoylalanine--D-glutamate ligase [alpha proteobacterium Q-1]